MSQQCYSGLDKYDPLHRIILYDDFDNGINGWTELIGNYEGSLETVLPPYKDHRPPQISTISMWDTGSVGSMEGNYALKIATRAQKGHQAVNIKRLTFHRKSKIRLETYFCFKPEASELKLGDLAPRSFGFFFDVQNNEQRVMPHIRYLNALDGCAKQKWQFKRRTTPFQKIGNEGVTVSHYHLSPNDWEDIPGATQQLCYNEIATKHNWHYLRFDFDLRTMQITGFQCNDRTFDVSELECIRIPAMPNLWCMLNIAFFVEADTDKRVFGYLDSILLSEELPVRCK